MRKPHERFIEMFRGKQNIITVTLVLIGGVFVAKTLWEIILEKYGEGWTIIVGALLLMLGYYVSDALHERSGGNLGH